MKTKSLLVWLMAVALVTLAITQVAVAAPTPALRGTSMFVDVPNEGLVTCTFAEFAIERPVGSGQYLKAIDINLVTQVAFNKPFGLYLDGVWQGTLSLGKTTMQPSGILVVDNSNTGWQRFILPAQLPNGGHILALVGYTAMGNQVVLRYQFRKQSLEFWFMTDRKTGGEGEVELQFGCLAMYNRVAYPADIALMQLFKQVPGNADVLLMEMTKFKRDILAGGQVVFLTQVSKAAYDAALAGQLQLKGEISTSDGQGGNMEKFTSYFRYLPVIHN